MRSSRTREDRCRPRRQWLLALLSKLSSQNPLSSLPDKCVPVSHMPFRAQLWPCGWKAQLFKVMTAWGKSSSQNAAGPLVQDIAAPRYMFVWETGEWVLGGVLRNKSATSVLLLGLYQFSLILEHLICQVVKSMPTLSQRTDS